MRLMLASAVAVLTLAGCSGPNAGSTAPTVTVTETVAVTETATPAVATVTATVTQTATETVMATETVTVSPGGSVANDAGGSVDVTDELLAGQSRTLWGPLVMSATSDGAPVVVATTIADPRGEDGSDAALVAIEVCEAAVQLLQGESDPRVSVMEADGSTFVVYGHPSYPGVCSEV